LSNFMIMAVIWMMSIDSVRPVYIEPPRIK